MNCTYPVGISFVCSECNTFRKLSQLLEYFETTSFPDYKTSILTSNRLILNKLLHSQQTEGIASGYFSN